MAGNADRQRLADLYYSFNSGGPQMAEAEVAGDLVGNGLEFVAPEHVGALTDSPILADGFHIEDDGTPTLADDAKVWWFPDYQVIDPWARLRDTGRVDFTLAAYPPPDSKD